ncbi:MAG: SufS family cysteine desulfurase [Bacteroidales bacterium]|nr:SufS family cysteine desulfurase [Bacteroidales bacterium]
MDIINQIREQFPALHQQVWGKPLIYLDNAATAQKHRKVLELQQRMSSYTNANIHRALHKLSADATELYEEGREAARSFLGAESREEIIFTSGATAALNLIASSLVRSHLNPGDKVLICEAEHHSNIVPWQLACEASGTSIEVLPVEESGEISLKRLKALLEADDRIRILTVNHISNVLGIINPVAEIVRIAHSKGVLVVIDGAQGVVHDRVSVRELDCDFYVFSGHKIYAPTGIGVLYGRRSILESMPPYMGGGDMVDRVSFSRTTYAPLPLKFEAGTPNFVAAASLKPALEFAASVRDDVRVQEYEKGIVTNMLQELQQIEGLKICGLPKDLSLKVPIFSIDIEGIHPSDVAQMLDKMGIAVRSGLMCAEPLVNLYSDRGLLRVSFAPYNTLAEAETFISKLKLVINMLK